MAELKTINTFSFFNNIPIYIINLLDSTERKNDIVNKFNGYKNIKFIEAVDGRNSEIFNKKYKVSYKTPLNFNTATIAVICSHAKAIQTAYNNNLETVCIFEDDVNIELTNKCNFTINDVYKNNNIWDIIQLYYTTNLDINNNHFIKNGIGLIDRDNINYPGSCYIINRKGMKKFLENVVLISNDISFNILPVFNDPEELLFAYLNSFMINRPFVYYYSLNLTFDNYFIYHDTSKTDICQVAQLNAKNKLISLYNIN